MHADNGASIRVLEKNGFTLAGRLKDHVWSGGGYVDELFYELLHGKYEISQNPKT